MRLKNIDVVTAHAVLKKQTVHIENGRFTSIRPTEMKDAGEDYTHHVLLPGFIDVHSHGTHGYDMMDGEVDSLEAISLNLIKEGTTRYLATTLTMDEAAIVKALKSYTNASFLGAKPLGIHLEGPYISKKFPGAQNPEYIIKGTIDQFKRFQSLCHQAIKIVTLAPEEQDEAFLDYLLDQGVVISMGHSAATEKDVEAALKKGIHRVTHCYNAMSPLHHRDLGLVGMTLLHDAMEAELIADLVHTSPNAIALLLKHKKNRLTLITDGMRAKGLKDGTYELGGQAVHVKESIARLENGALAGSTLQLNEAFKTIMALGEDLVVTTRMLSLNPARTLKVDHELGQIKSGYLADFVIMDHGFKIKKVAVEGDIKHTQT